ncbi:hypothetical protein SAMN05216241_103217 [Limimonas halophila]|uniref:Uncharacterized protein n=1 Tax=Limimonas halophila TaxID=1082479 RepID=A0A1G7Q410_9PROT|nr:hypothetical protein [Limimonas halophila]SDF93205.1 hypothetical protein SAMN05216241_103217 [Limimonas halophila]
MADQQDRRRRHEFRRFRRQLEALSSADIRQRLDSNRIRSPERRALAEEVLAARAAEPGAEAAADESARPAPTDGRAIAVSALRPIVRPTVRGWRWVHRRDGHLARTLGGAALAAGALVAVIGLLRR